MVYDYVVTLENRNRRYIDNVSVLLLMLSVVFFCMHLVRGGMSEKASARGESAANFLWGENKFLLLGTLLVIVLFGINLYQLFFGNRKVIFSRSLLVAGIFWLSFPTFYWVGLPLIALGLLEKYAKNDLEIGFSANQIVINNLIKRRFTWQHFNNVMLKDDLLTMDFKNNRILQRMTIDDDSDADEDEFNEYCRLHLSTIS